MRVSVVTSAIVAVLVGFGGSVAVILEATKAVGASSEQTASWVAALCLSMMVTTAYLSLRHRLPIVTAWSTPGAALIATTTGITIEAAIGAFILAACLILMTAAIRPLNALVERIPSAIASSMLAGVLFGFVVAIFEALLNLPYLVAPLILAFVLLRLYSPAWAVLLVLGLGVVLVYALDLSEPVADLTISNFVWITPEFDLAVMIGLGIPLYIVTMASQNLPGFAVLRAAGYAVPTRSILTITGLASLLSAGFGAHTSNLAAIVASICTGPEAHPDKTKRWLGGPIYAGGYAILALFGGALVIILESFPAELIAAMAGIALTGPLVNAIGTGLADEKNRFAAVTTFVVTASGISAFGISAAFWGLLGGLVIYTLEGLVKQNSSAR